MAGEFDTEKDSQKIHVLLVLSAKTVQLEKSIPASLFTFNEPSRKKWGARLIDIINHLSHEVFFCDTVTRSMSTKATNFQFFHEVRVTFLDSSPIFLGLRDHCEG